MGFGVWDSGFLDRLREGLSRTKQQIVGRFEEIVQRADAREPGVREIDVDTVEALEELLISDAAGHLTDLPPGGIHLVVLPGCASTLKFKPHQLPRQYSFLQHSQSPRADEILGQIHAPPLAG